MKIGFVGLGLMGQPMVESLLKAGFALHVFSDNPASMRVLQQRGAIAGTSVADIAGKVDIFCSCRVTPQQSRSVFTGPDGVLSATSRPSVCIDFATIDPMTSREIGGVLTAEGIDFLDAPVSGGPDGARAGTLSIIVGGAAPVVTAVSTIFDTLGKQTFHMGGIGTGVTAKLCNNMISITTHALVAEAMVLGTKSGVNAVELYEVLRNSSAYSRTLERVVPNHFLPRNFEAAATIEMIVKDLQAAIDLSVEEGVSLRLPAAAMRWFSEAVAHGHKKDDIASVILPMEAIAGVRVGGQD
ncbi:MAG: 3-hydroxyisobutyrate dehydrogenase [Gammaproteobacteria bacterium]|jgi:3-hydroxyisobutyrate dehydrogenase